MQMNKNQFYAYAIFFICTILFFAILSIVFSLLDSHNQPTELPSHAKTTPQRMTFGSYIRWASDQGPFSEEPIVDRTYYENPQLQQKINDLQDPVYQKAIKRYHLQELADELGEPSPNEFMVEPFVTDGGRLQDTISNLVDEYTYKISLPNPDILKIGSYDAGKKFLKNT